MWACGRLQQPNSQSSVNLTFWCESLAFFPLQVQRTQVNDGQYAALKSTNVRMLACKLLFEEPLWFHEDGVLQRSLRCILSWSFTSREPTRAVTPDDTTPRGHRGRKEQGGESCHWMSHFLKASGYSLGQRQDSEMAGLLKTAFYSSQIYNSLPHIWFSLITFTFQIQTVKKHHSARRESAECCMLYALLSLWNDLKILPLGESCRVSEDVLCCEYEGVKKTNKKQGQYVACTVQENVFSHETYGCASWSPYIVAVISDFTLGSHSFISLVYWRLPCLRLTHVYLCHFSLLQPRKFPDRIWCLYMSLYKTKTNKKKNHYLGSQQQDFS